MGYLTKDGIMSAVDFKLVEEPVDEWGGVVFIKPMSAEDREKFEDYFLDENKVPNVLRASLVAYCVCDSNGARLFDDESIPELAKKDSHVIERLFNKCQDLCAVKEGAVEDLEKN